MPASSPADRAEFSALFARHCPAVWRFVARRAWPDAIDDVVAETFLAAWRRFDDLPSDALPWLLNAAGSNARKSDPDAVVPMPQRAFVSLARDTLTPVRITYEFCRRDAGLGLEQRILDYISFEELARSPENLKLLELSPYPGVPIVDGIDIDEAEERDEARPSATPTPTAPRAVG